jgi:DNA-binding response OmpR family regulator
VNADILKLTNYSARLASDEGPDEGRVLDAAIMVSERASARLEEWMHAGPQHVVITTRGGGAVRARLAMAQPQFTEQTFSMSGVKINWVTGTISRGRNRVGLSRTELRLLTALVDADGAPVSRRALVAAAWPRERLSERDSHLTVYMCVLRKRLSTIGLGDAVRTERGIGYRMDL